MVKSDEQSVGQTLEADDLINFEEQKKKMIKDEQFHGDRADSRQKKLDQHLYGNLGQRMHRTYSHENRSNYSQSYSNKRGSADRLTSHNDSFEYNTMNLTRRKVIAGNFRQYLIKQILLPQRARRKHIDSIHSLFKLDFVGLCSYNKFNFIVMMLNLFVYAHSIGFILSDFNLVILLLVFGIYPLIFAIISTIALVHNLVCTRDYQNLSVWHRNSIIYLCQNIIFASCTTASMIQFYIVASDDISILEDPKELLEVIWPIFVLSIFFIIMVLCVYHKNQVAYLIGSLLIVAQYIFCQLCAYYNICDYLIWKNFGFIPLCLFMVGVDIFYLNMSIRKPIVGYDYQNRQGSFISNVDDFLDQDISGTK